MDINSAWGVFIIGVTFGIPIYIMRDHVRAYLKGMSYEEFLEYELDRLNMKIVKEQKESETRRNKNFLSNLRDDWSMELKSALIWIVAGTSVTSLLCFGLDLLGVLSTFDSYTILGSAVCPVALICFAHFLNRKYPSNDG